MEDAKKKKKDWQQKLHDLKLKNLLQLRDSLMAMAVIQTMGVGNCERDGDQVSDSIHHVMILLFFMLYA